MINIGDRVKDVISGFTGVVTCRAEYITGCVQFVVTPEGLKDGKLLDSSWFGEGRLEVIAPLVHRDMSKTAAPARTGGPQRDTPPMK